MSQPSPSPTPDANDMQGEGSHDAARRHRESVESFVESSQVDQAAREAASTTDAEENGLQDAEAEGLSHSKGEK